MENKIKQIKLFDINTCVDDVNLFLSTIDQPKILQINPFMIEYKTKRSISNTELILPITEYVGITYNYAFISVTDKPNRRYCTIAFTSNSILDFLDCIIFILPKKIVDIGNKRQNNGITEYIECKCEFIKYNKKDGFFYVNNKKIGDNYEDNGVFRSLSSVHALEYTMDLYIRFTTELNPSGDDVVEDSLLTVIENFIVNDFKYDNTNSSIRNVLKLKKIPSKYAYDPNTNELKIFSNQIT